MENFLIKTRTEGNLLNIRAAIFAGVHFPHKYNADYKFFCHKLYNFIAEDGAAQPYLYSQVKNKHNFFKIKRNFH